MEENAFPYAGYVGLGSKFMHDDDRSHIAFIVCNAFEMLGILCCSVQWEARTWTWKSALKHQVWLRDVAPVTLQELQEAVVKDLNANEVVDKKKLVINITYSKYIVVSKEIYHTTHVWIEDILKS